MDIGQQAAERYRTLAQGLGEQFGHRYGWMSKVARQLSVDPSYLKKILEGDRTSVGIDTIELAVRNVPIRWGYFRDAIVSSWKDYVGPDEAASASKVRVPGVTIRVRQPRWTEAIERAKALERDANLLAAKNEQLPLEDCLALARVVLSDPAVQAALEISRTKIGDRNSETYLAMKARELAEIILFSASAQPSWTSKSKATKRRRRKQR